MVKNGILLVSALLLISVSGSSQDARETLFGPLFDGAENSHNELIAQGWVYLFDARIPSDRQAVKGDPLGNWRARRADSNNCWVVGQEHKGAQERIMMNILREGMHGKLCFYGPLELACSANFVIGYDT